MIADSLWDLIGQILMVVCDS